MLLESDVVNAVSAELEARGYRVGQKLGTTEKGDDIIAVKQTVPPRELYVEAKGETSSSSTSARYGKPFDSAQIRVHVAEAFYKAATVVSRQHPGVEIRAGIALPDTRLHRARVEDIGAALSRLGIAVFWVTQDGDVQIASPWEP